VGAPVADTGLRLLAMDADDLEVISAALQDAITHIGDIFWEKEGRSLTVAFNRLRWEASAEERVRTAVQLGCVTRVRHRNLRTDAKDAVLQLLAVTFEPAAEAPAGLVTFAFADGGDLAIEVECIDAALADVSEPWRVAHKPAHEA
jgi:hypothetical protein